MANKYQIFKCGNLVRYNGDGVSEKCVAIIKKIKKEKEGASYLIKFISSEQWPNSQEILVSEKDISHIILRKENLLELGFQIKGGLFFKDGKKIRHFVFSGIDVINDYGFRALENCDYNGQINKSDFLFDISGKIICKNGSILNSESVSFLLDFTTPVNQIHTLQNYWIEHFEIELDISKIKLNYWQL